MSVIAIEERVEQGILGTVSNPALHEAMFDYDETLVHPETCFLTFRAGSGWEFGTTRLGVITTFTDMQDAYQAIHQAAIIRRQASK